MVAEIGDSICPWCLCSITSDESQTTCDSCKKIIVVSFSGAEDVSQIELLHWLRCLCPPMQLGEVLAALNPESTPASMAHPD